MYYGANVDAKLFMGQSVAVPLPTPLADTFEEVALTGSISLPPYTRETAFFNVTNDAVRRSLGGKRGDQTIEGNVVLDWDEDSHNDMFADAESDQAVNRNWYIEYPTGRRKDFHAFLSSWIEEPFDAGEDAKEHRANWALTVDGAVTTTPAPVTP